MTFSLAWRMLQVVNISYLFRAPVLEKSSKMLLSVSLEVELGFHTKAGYCFLAAPPLSLDPLPSLINNYLNLPFGTQDRSWKGKSIPYKRETGGPRNAFMARSPRRSCWFHCPLRHYSHIHPNRENPMIKNHVRL